MNGNNCSSCSKKDLLPPLPESLPPSSDVQVVPQATLAEISSLSQTNLSLSTRYRLRSLRAGCYLVKLTSSSSYLSVADGTLRVESHSDGRTASGDLYQRSLVRAYMPPKPGLPGRYFLTLAPGPNPADGIPIFPRKSYTHFLRVTQILESLTIADSFTLGFDMYRFDGSSRTWSNEGAFTAQMCWTVPPAGYPTTGDYLEGDLKNSSGTIVGRLTMGWVSQYLRRAVVEIDRVSASESPINNGAGVNWRSIFDQVGWDVTVVESNNNVTEPSGEGWTDAECHQGMLTWRDSANLDTQWRYHLLCVRRLDSTERGIMYDAYGGDTNNIPREGAALSSHWVFPNADPWGECKGIRFGAATFPYFRTAVHEIGHALMMFHPASTTGNHIMQVTPQIAANVVAPVQFPDNIEWAFLVEDQRRLRHLPDVVVRPGTVLRFGTDVGTAYAGIPVSPLDVAIEIEGLEVQVSPLLEAVPIGAPVRVNFRLVNQGAEPVSVPSRLGLKTGQVTGVVIDPSGARRDFASIVRYLDTMEMQILDPGKSLGDSLTLLRGPDGALFQSPGMYRVIVNVTWDAGGCLTRLSGETSVMVTPPVDEAHAKAALKVLSVPDVLITLVVGGDHLTDGIEAIQASVNNPVLRPHFAYIEAKRLAQRFGRRKPNLKAASELITDETVMSPAEIRKAAKLVKAGGIDTSHGKSIAKALKSKAKPHGVSEEIKNILDS